MQRNERVACGLLVVALLITLGTGMVMATDTGEEPPKVCDPGICIDLVYECSDVTAIGAPFQTRGVVTNCGPQKFDEVFVKEVINDNVEPPIFILSPITLDPGQSVEFFSEFSSDECPATQEAFVEAKVWDTGAACRVKDFADAACDCQVFTDRCRTPGFWGVRAGTGNDGVNITQAVINAAPAGIVVCGETVDNTSLLASGSALEAVCVHPRGEQIHQLARHLTAAALNCVVSGSGMDCDGTSIEALFSSCNSVCMAGTDDEAIQDCGLEIDCWNNGGTLLDTGMCQLGTCSETGEPCEEDVDCGYNLDGGELTCLPFKDTCHFEPLVNEDLGLFFDPPGPASSSRECNKAIKNETYLLD
ncbi:MAG: hypothetical protein IFK94_12120 [Acidobacteria bacterium]|uniref:Uncharacterized protein n=1 Tax=Candidatus Polarisedimenticola svalbardensis TaxID=2886004 RepID=A0A8J7CF09_9BACT|nr:hypothetical protein [Candidatus Polarisedimenticola svalbardensis]